MQASCCPFSTYVTESLARLDVFYSSRMNVSLLGYYYLRMAMWEMSPLICSISVYFLKYQYLLLLYPHVKYHNNMLYQSPQLSHPSKLYCVYYWFYILMQGRTTMTCWLLVGALEVLPVPKKVRCYPCYSLIFPEAFLRNPLTIW